MFLSHCAVLFALVINFQHVESLMVRTVDGSFVPWSLEARAPGGGGIAVLMNNHLDEAYIVSSYRYTTSLLSAGQGYRQLS